ncbi:MAG: M24 family metallopeptidase, partial [Patescibacteria group bacterium]
MKPKTAQEIEILAEGGHILARIMKGLAGMCVVGAKAADLDAYAEQEISAAGGTPSFKGFGKPGQEFPNALCVSPNDMLVHGIPHKDLVFKAGDLVGLDLGMEY